MALFALLLIVPSLLEPPHATYSARPVVPFDTAEGKLLALRPLGDLMERDIDDLARSLEYRLGVDVTLLPPLPIPPEARDPATGHVVADRLLNWMFATRPDDAWRYVAVTSDPLQTGDAHSLYGYANAVDHVAVLTTFHFEAGLHSTDRLERALARDKLARAAVHEMAHTLGLDHCEHDLCLMQRVIPLDRLDTRTSLCHDCIQRLDRALATPNDPWREQLDLGDSFFHRRYYTRALHHYDLAKALLTPHDDPRALSQVENRIGASLLSMQIVAEGEQNIRRAIDLDPAAPQPHYNLAIVYAYAGERALAQEELERGMALDQDPVSRHGFAGRFLLDILDDPDAAAAHLRAYAAAGGDSPYLLEALDTLSRPGAVLFTHGEVEVIHATW
ncbi:MAG: hypothetical protein CMH57_00410 [Myxococcales bacterium]|nr:hypothetical protein [Myxococcales bacterium]